MHCDTITCRKEAAELNIATLIAVLALAVVLFLVIRYLIREKKKGNKCIGCPYAGSCGHMGHPEQDE